MRRISLLLLPLLLVGLAGRVSAQTADPRFIGTIDAAESVTLDNLPAGRGSAAISIVDICTCTLVVEGRVGATWKAIDGAPTIDADGIYSVNAAGLDGLRVRASAFMSGSTGVGIRVSSAGGGSGGAGVLGEVEVEIVGFATEAKQDTQITALGTLLTTAAFNAALGTAGTADTQVLSVQGIASMTPILATVTGTVTANLSATDNAVLDDIADGIAVTGTVTANLSATDNAVLDDIADGIAVTNAGTFVVQIDGAALTALQLTDNLVSVEDAVAGSGFSGVAMLAVRQDSQVDLCADADFCPVTVDADGNLRVTLSPGGSGGTAAADGSSFTRNTTELTPAGFVVDEMSPATIAEGDVGAARMTPTGDIRVVITDSSGADLVQDTQLQHGTALGTVTDVTGSAIMFRASATAPSAEGTDDAVLPWATLSGALAVQPTYAGAIGVAGSGANGTGVARVTIATDDSIHTTLSAALTALQLIDNSETAATGLKYTSTGAGDAEDEHEVKGSAAVLWSITATNTAATVAYLRCENDTAANTTTGGETVELDLAIPGATTGAGITFSFPRGMAFSAGLTCWIVTGEADTDTAEVGADDVKLLYTFK